MEFYDTDKKMGVVKSARRLSHVHAALFIFFFKQKTAYELCGRDWSSDVCSSDLVSLSGHPIIPLADEFDDTVDVSKL